MTYAIFTAGLLTGLIIYHLFRKSKPGLDYERGFHDGAQATRDTLAYRSMQAKIEEQRRVGL